MKRTYNAEDTEPEQSNFKIPSEKEHCLTVTDVNPLKLPDGTEDDNIQIVKLEIVGGDEEGLTMINRVNLDQGEKSFYFARLFLKAIGEPYKGEFFVETDRWIGRTFFATVKHTDFKGKTYANIAEYNFDKKVEQVFQAKNPDGVKTPEEIAWEE
jgi:hypothetical protein